jgi:hypothetical protein
MEIELLENKINDYEDKLNTIRRSLWLRQKRKWNSFTWTRNV